ncbi:hypothetical protein DXG01_000590 [Tephrocybe rancida]|nr:hypothetical protein DXG01_000590 [Tephrocybe rancida]
MQARCRGCATNPTDLAVLTMEKHFLENKIDGANWRQTGAPALQVFFHVISENDTPAGGNIPDSQIADQINVINEAYAKTGIRWALKNTTRTTNADWFNKAAPENEYQTAMKNQLRMGGAADLNVYSVGCVQLDDVIPFEISSQILNDGRFKTGNARGLLGYATFPYQYADAPRDDGVVLRYSSLPGGTAVPYNLGQTLTHEAGHWVGLYHTFQGGCESPGDHVFDTPAEDSAAFGCPDKRDSCPGGGVDPIRKLFCVRFLCKLTNKPDF